MPRGYSILTVCTGNICRSPLAEQLLRARLGAPHGFSSAGLRAIPGAPMDPHAAHESRRLGGTPSGASTQLNDAIIDASDLILTMTVQQRDEVASHFPASLRKTYALAEFAKIADTYPAELIAERNDPFASPNPFANFSRLRGVALLSNDDDIADPIGRPLKVHSAVAEQISRYVDRLVSALRQAGL